jgi:hypothetical protein
VQRIRACSAPFAGSWLLQNPHSPLTDKEFTVALRVRLGESPFPAFRAGGYPLCRKNANADPLHALSCDATRHNTQGVVLRHDKVCQLIAQFAISMGCLASCTNRSDGGRGQVVPDGVIHTADKSYMFDVSGVHTMSEGYHNRDPEAILKARAAHKVRIYREHSFLQNCEFVPFAMETNGLLGPKAVEFAELLATEQLAFGTRSPRYLTSPLSTFRMELACV